MKIRNSHNLFSLQKVIEKLKLLFFSPSELQGAAAAEGCCGFCLTPGTNKHKTEPLPEYFITTFSTDSYILHHCCFSWEIFVEHCEQRRHLFHWCFVVCDQTRSLSSWRHLTCQTSQQKHNGAKGFVLFNHGCIKCGTSLRRHLLFKQGDHTTHHLQLVQ